MKWNKKFDSSKYLISKEFCMIEFPAWGKK